MNTQETNKMKKLIQEVTNTSVGVGNYSKPIVLLKRKKLIQCKFCGGIAIDKCQKCKDRKGKNG